jgi:hypothetical protein
MKVEKMISDTIESSYIATRPIFVEELHALL